MVLSQAIDPVIPWVRRVEPAPPARAVPDAEDNEVAWIVDDAKSLRQLSFSWSIPGRRLVALNPELDPARPLPAGTRVRVHARDAEHPTRSIGAPNRGRLVAGVPMPEGEHWTLKRSRQRVYGTAETVHTLHDALLAYGAHFQDAPPVPLGDLSVRRGGKIDPHQSHQSGRDVDIGFVLRPGDEGSRRVNAESFDREKNWFLVRELVDSGQVQSIFTSVNARRWLYQAAVNDVPAEDLPRYFDRISYEHGHGHHMHVRFRCADEHRACQGASAG